LHSNLYELGCEGAADIMQREMWKVLAQVNAHEAMKLFFGSPKSIDMAMLGLCEYQSGMRPWYLIQDISGELT